MAARHVPGLGVSSTPTPIRSALKERREEPVDSEGGERQTTPARRRLSYSMDTPAFASAIPHARTPYDPDRTTIGDSKRRNLRKTFRDLAGYSAGACILLLLYYSFLMIYPYLQAFFWAILFTCCLSFVKDTLVDWMARLDGLFRPHKLSLTLGVLAMLLAIGVANWKSSLIVGIDAILTVIFLAAIFMDRHTFVTLSLLVFFGFFVSFPLFALIKTCVAESMLATNKVTEFLEASTEFRQLMDDYERSELYQAARSYAASWGYDVDFLKLENLRQHAVAFIQVIGTNIPVFFGGALTVASHFGSLLVSGGVFISCLYYFLESKDSLTAQLAQLSPFDGQDNKKLIRSIKRSITRTFVCSLLLGLMRGLLTYVTFWWVDFDLKVIFSVLSGFLAMMPVISSWVIWLPATLILYLQKRVFEAILMAAIHVSANYLLDTAVYSFIPGANSYFMGLSIVLGISQFGLIGVLLGPLIVGTFITMKDIYVSYITQADTPDNSRISMPPAPDSPISSKTRWLLNNN